MKINKKIIIRKKENLIKKILLIFIVMIIMFFVFNLIIKVNIYHNERFDNITFSSSLDNDPYYTF